MACRDALQQFIGMLDLNYWFPICSQLPAKDQTVVFNGKTMVIMRKRMLSEEEDDESFHQEVLQDIKATEYVLLPSHRGSII